MHVGKHESHLLRVCYREVYRIRFASIGGKVVVITHNDCVVTRFKFNVFRVWRGSVAGSGTPNVAIKIDLVVSKTGFAWSGSLDNDRGSLSLLSIGFQLCPKFIVTEVEEFATAPTSTIPPGVLRLVNVKRLWEARDRADLREAISDRHASGQPVNDGSTASWAVLVVRSVLFHSAV